MLGSEGTAGQTTHAGLLVYLAEGRIPSSSHFFFSYLHYYHLPHSLNPQSYWVLTPQTYSLTRYPSLPSIPPWETGMFPYCLILTRWGQMHPGLVHCTLGRCISHKKERSSRRLGKGCPWLLRRTVTNSTWTNMCQDHPFSSSGSFCL